MKIPNKVIALLNDKATFNQNECPNTGKEVE